jgi:hypothetical protein
VAMAVWDELKVILLELEGSGALSAYPDPSVDESRQPPFRIRFAPWATDVAEELHRRFGDDVELVVGLLHYPGPEPPRQHANAPDDIAEVDPTVMTVELDAPIVVASGHHTRGALRIHNTGTDPIVIATNGQVTARVVDPRTGEVVGGYAGFQALPGVYFRADAGQHRGRARAGRHRERCARPRLCRPCRGVGDTGRPGPRRRRGFAGAIWRGPTSTPPIARTAAPHHGDLTLGRVGWPSSTRR